MNRNHKFSIGNVDLDTLKTDADFQREAERHLPRYIDEISKIVAETVWDELYKATRSGPIKLTTSKFSFISEKTREFKRSVSASDRRDYLKTIISKLKEMKADSDKRQG